MVLHKIKDIQNFNTLTPHYIHFMTNETYQNCTKFILMKIHKYTNILKVISLNYNPYNSCNHFQSHGGVRFYACTCSPWLLLLWTHLSIVFRFFHLMLHFGLPTSLPWPLQFSTTYLSCPTTVLGSSGSPYQVKGFIVLKWATLISKSPMWYQFL